MVSNYVASSHAKSCSDYSYISVGFQNKPTNDQITAHGTYHQVKNRSVKQASFLKVVWYQCLTNTIRINFILKINHCSTD